jgi:hypothetical protein
VDITATANTYIDGLTFDTYGHVTGVTTVAGFDGDYNSLTNKPTIPANVGDLGDVTVTSAATGEVLRYSGTAWVDAQLDYADLSGTPTLATVATSGAYADLSGTPTIPSNIEDLTNVTVTAAATGEVLRYDGAAWVDAVLNYSDLTGTPTLATVATTGAYSDLTGTPTIPANAGDLGDVTITAAATGEVLRYNGTAWVDAQLDYSDLSGTPTLATVATSGSYDDLSNQPTIPANAGDLGDVTITAAATGEVLKYNGSAWVDANVDYSELTGVPSTFAPSAHTHAISEVTNLQTSLDAKADSSDVGAANGIAPLDANSLVPSANLPSYVDDVLEYADLTTMNGLSAGDKVTGKIYVALDTGKIYRWSGSAFIEINTSVGSADTAVALATSRTISLSGDVTGSVSFDGTADVDIVATVVDDSHSHIIGDVDGLQTALDGKSATGHTHAANDLTDVTITAAVTGEVLKYNGSAWVDANVDYSELTGVPATFAPAAHTHAISEVTNLQTSLDAKQDASSAFDGDYGSLTNVPATFAPSAHDLASHSNVAATAPTDGQVLTWNNTASEWEPQTSSGGITTGKAIAVSIVFGG